MRARTDLDIGALVVGNARVGGTWRKKSASQSQCGVAKILQGGGVRTKIDANGTLVDFVAHDGYM
jgi:hypothetical protein